MIIRVGYITIRSTSVAHLLNLNTLKRQDIWKAAKYIFINREFDKLV